MTSHCAIASHFPQPEVCPEVTAFNKYEEIFFDSCGCHYDGTCYEAAYGARFGTKSRWNLIIWVHDPLETKSQSVVLGVKKALKTFDNDLNYIIRAVHSDGPWFSNSSK